MIKMQRVNRGGRSSGHVQCSQRPRSVARPRYYRGGEAVPVARRLQSEDSKLRSAWTRCIDCSDKMLTVAHCSVTATQRVLYVPQSYMAVDCM